MADPKADLFEQQEEQESEPERKRRLILWQCDRCGFEQWILPEHVAMIEKLRTCGEDDAQRARIRPTPEVPT